MSIKVRGNYFVDEDVDEEGNLIQEEVCYNFYQRKSGGAKSGGW